MWQRATNWQHGQRMAYLSGAPQIRWRCQSPDAPSRAGSLQPYVLPTTRTCSGQSTALGSCESTRYRNLPAMSSSTPSPSGATH